jgi:hypothetical protein
VVVTGETVVGAAPTAVLTNFPLPLMLGTSCVLNAVGAVPPRFDVTTIDTAIKNNDIASTIDDAPLWAEKIVLIMALRWVASSISGVELDEGHGGEGSAPVRCRG